MNEQINITNAALEDIPAIIELWKRLMEHHKNLDPIFSRSPDGHEKFAEFLKGHIENEDSCVLVATNADDLVGYCMAGVEDYPPVLVRKKYIALFGMYVAETHRRCGIGQKLIKTLLRYYKGKDTDRIEVKFSTFNESAKLFWTNMGFKPYLKTAFLEI
jgi:GNAT superfamily N-acetyltransferase